MKKFDAVIVGSGFSGSLLAWVLAKAGWRVALVDRSRHPRFAIGESSTPTADFLLAYLADRYGLSELRPLACFGQWRDTYPEIQCGKKRGFTYFAHSRNERFIDTQDLSRSMMVAASREDYWSDTHWLRADVDAFLVGCAASSGCAVWESTDVVEINRSDQDWRIELNDRSSYCAESQFKETLSAKWLIDAAGAGGITERWCGNERDDHWMRTKTGALFGHFQGVGSITPFLTTASPDPIAGFHADDSAQHHVLESGWVWMLRFENGTTSVGLTQPTALWPSDLLNPQFDRPTVWQAWLNEYPTLSDMLSNADLVAPASGLQFTPRLSRCCRLACGDGWVAMPSAYGLVDPLHSTGIAHALSGVIRVADILISQPDTPVLQSQRWQQYNQDLRQEVRWIDLLVSGCYSSLPNFELFTAFAAFYFVGAIQFERQMSLDPSHWPMGFLNANNVDLVRAAESCYADISRTGTISPNIVGSHVDSIRRAIADWNDVGLLDAKHGKRIPHTAPPKYASRVL